MPFGIGVWELLILLLVLLLVFGPKRLPEMGRSLGKIFPRATVEIIAGAHHNDILQREVVAAIARFAQG